MDVSIGYVDSWQIRDAKDVHPSHRVAVIEAKEILRLIEEESERGNLFPEKGFSAAIFLSDLNKELIFAIVEGDCEKRDNQK